MHKRILPFVLMILLLLCCAGCAQPAPAGPDPGRPLYESDFGLMPNDTRFVIHYGDSSKIVDRDGSLIFEVYGKAEILRDSFTQEQSYIAVIRETPGADQSQDGYEYKFTHYHHTLYDLNGAQQYEEISGYPKAVCGDRVLVYEYDAAQWVIRTDNTKVTLRDLSNGRILFEQSGVMLYSSFQKSFAVNDDTRINVYDFEGRMRFSHTLVSDPNQFLHFCSGIVLNNREYFALSYYDQKE